MDEIFEQDTQQYISEVGHQPPDAEIYRMIDEIAEDMEWDEDE